MKYFTGAVTYDIKAIHEECFGSATRPNGRVAIVEFNGKGWIEGMPGHHTAKEVITGEMKAAGYTLQRDFDFLPRQHFLTFSKATG